MDNAKLLKEKKLTDESIILYFSTLKVRIFDLKKIKSIKKIYKISLLSKTLGMREMNWKTSFFRRLKMHINKVFSYFHIIFYIQRKLSELALKHGW